MTNLLLHRFNRIVGHLNKAVIHFYFMGLSFVITLALQCVPNKSTSINNTVNHKTVEYEPHIACKFTS